jgi:hypothetical protein
MKRFYMDYHQFDIDFTPCSRYRYRYEFCIADTIDISKIADTHNPVYI